MKPAFAYRELKTGFPTECAESTERKEANSTAPHSLSLSVLSVGSEVNPVFSGETTADYFAAFFFPAKWTALP
jgi:hypothetical protein